MKKVVVLLVSMIAVTTSAQVRSAAVAAERQIMAPQTMVTCNNGAYYRVRSNYLAPATGAYCTYAASRVSYPTVSDAPRDTIDWPVFFFGGGALLLLYMLYSGIRKETTIKIPRPHQMVTSSFTDVSQRVQHITLANGGGVLIKERYFE